MLQPIPKTDWKLVRAKLFWLLQIPGKQDGLRGAAFLHLLPQLSFRGLQQQQQQQQQQQKNLLASCPPPPLPNEN